MTPAILAQFQPRPYALLVPRLVHALNRRHLRGVTVHTLFVGDSHVAFLARHPRACALLGDAAIAGVPGDDAGNVLHRLADGEFDAVRATRVVVVLGGNMLASWMPAEAAAAAIVRAALGIAVRVGATQVVVHGVLPTETSPLRDALNAHLAAACAVANITYLAPPDRVTTIDGAHLDAEGYFAWALHLWARLRLRMGVPVTLSPRVWRLIDGIVRVKRALRGRPA